MPELKLVGGPGSPRTIQLAADRDEWVVGAGVSCHVVLADESVAARHARIRRRGVGFTIEALDEGADVRLNGQEQSGLSSLEDDDEILLGKSLLRWSAGDAFDALGGEISLDDSIASFSAVPSASGMFAAIGLDTDELTSDTGAANAPDDETVSGDHLMDAMTQVVSALRAGRAVPEMAMASLSSAFGADRALLYLPVKGVRSLVASFVGPAELGPEVGMDEETLHRACAAGGPIEAQLEGLGRASPEARSMVAVELELDGATGTLALDAPRALRNFQPQDHKVLSAFAGNLAFMLSCHSMVRRLEDRLDRWADSAAQRAGAPPGGWTEAGAAALEEAAAGSKPVLVLGEPATGKRLAAAAIHTASKRAREPLVEVDCAAAADVARALFGFEDISEDIEEPGALALARRGTVVLTHVTALPIPIQERLVAFLAAGTYLSEGDATKNRSAARLVFTSHLDPGQAGGAGWFLDDLYRLFKRRRIVRIPALREDEAVLEGATRQLIREIARHRKRAVRDLTPEAWEILREYAWPGNQVELRMVLGEAVERSPGEAVEGDTLEELLRRS
jgi:hypothetical protein